jgi:hypothetical protein
MKNHLFKHSMRIWGIIALILAVGVLLSGGRAIWAQDGSGFVLHNPVVSGPVAPVDTTGLPPAPAFQAVEGMEPVVRRVMPLPGHAASLQKAFTAGQTANVQLQPGPETMPPPLNGWEGIGYTGVLPPDTNGQIGPNHYVQIVNDYYGAWVRVWDRGGAQLYDFGMQNLWPGGSPCRDQAYGDPVVLYDQLADRWLLTQFTDSTAPYYECIAVSKTGNPTDLPADWWLYTFNVHNSKFNDYPKFGVWPDGYYMSANQFDPTNNWSWEGAGVWVFDRQTMLSGGNAGFQYFDLASVNKNYGGLLPSNLMGNRLPPDGAPNYFMAVDMDWSGSNDILHIFEFHTDWATPANSTFSLAKDIVVDPFDWDITGIPQPGTGQQLDALADRLMMHLWYRNYGDHESLVVNHTVDTGGDHAGIRWYEIRGGAVDTTLSDATIHQQGTYTPDGVHRWMASVAMDRVGNLAAGFSVSDATTVFPGIRYAGRLYSDPLGQFTQGESTLINGGGSQTAYDRWGDYSSLTVDPVDDCTFWYTTEYMKATSSAQWSTYVGSFKFDNCCGGQISDVDGLSVSKSGNDVILNWLDAPGVTEYRIYRAEDDPYFTPDDATNYLSSSATNSFTDSGAAGDASKNYYYKVLGVDICPPADPNYTQRVGEFDFTLVPGSN